MKKERLIMNDHREDLGDVEVSSKAEKMMSFVENSIEFLPKGSIENMSVFEREEVNDTLIFLHELQVYPHESLWDAMRRLYPSPPHSPDNDDCSKSKDEIKMGEKRNISAISTASEFETLPNITVSPENYYLHSPKRHCPQSEIESSSGTLDPIFNTIRKEAIPENREIANEIVETSRQYIPKSILRTKTVTKKSRVVFHDTVTLVTHFYNTTSGSSEYQLNQVEESINRLAYERKETPVQDSMDRARRRINFDDLQSPVTDAPMQNLTSITPDVNANIIYSSSQNRLDSEEDSKQSADQVKKVLFPVEDTKDLESEDAPVLQNTNIVSQIVEEYEQPLENSLKDDMITFSEEYHQADALVFDVPDSSFVSYDSSFITSIEETLEHPPTVDVDAPPSMLVLYSQDLESSTPPHNHDSHHPAVTTNTATIKSFSDPVTSCTSISSTSFHYQSFSPPSQDAVPLSTSNPQQLPPSHNMEISAFTHSDQHADSTTKTSDVSDPLKLSQWPSVVWTRTKSLLPAPHLIRTKPPGVVVYLIQKNMRFEDNLALQAAMVASQTLQLPLVVWALLERDIIEDVEEMGRISHSSVPKIAVVTPQTPKTSSSTNPKLGSIAPEKLSLIQKSVAKLTSLRDLQQSLSKHCIPLLVYDYPVVPSSHGTNANTANIAAHTPKSLAIEHLLSTSSFYPDEENSDQGLCHVSVLFTDDFSHPHTGQWISCIAQSHPHVPIFCVDSSSLVCPNLSIPLLDSNMVVYQQPQALPSKKTPHKTLSNWVMSQETFDDQLLQAQCDYQDKLFTLQQDAHAQYHRDPLDHLPNEWRLVSDSNSIWTYAAQAQLQQELFTIVDRKEHSFLVNKSDKIRLLRNLTEMLASISLSIASSTDPMTPFNAKMPPNVVTPAAKQSSFIPHNQPAAHFTVVHFGCSVVCSQWEALQESLRCWQTNAPDKDRLRHPMNISDALIQYLILSYQMGLFSPQNILALNHFISSLTSTLPSVVRVKQQIKRLVKECMAWDYAQLMLYDSRQLQCVIHPATGASLPWMQVLPLETLTFLFKDSNQQEKNQLRRNSLKQQTQVVLSELRLIWRKYFVQSSLAWASFTPTQPIIDALAILSFPFLSISHGNKKENQADADVVISQERIQWWLLVCLVQAPAVSVGVNLAFRAFALYFSVGHAEDCLSPAVFLLALMQLPAKLQKLVDVNPWLVDDPLLTNQLNVFRSAGKDQDNTESESFWKCLEERFYAVVS